MLVRQVHTGRGKNDRTGRRSSRIKQVPSISIYINVLSMFIIYILMLMHFLEEHFSPSAAGAESG